MIVHFKLIQEGSTIRTTNQTFSCKFFKIYKILAVLNWPNVGAPLCPYLAHPETQHFHILWPVSSFEQQLISHTHKPTHRHTHHTHSDKLWTNSPEVGSRTMSLSSIGLYVAIGHSVLLTCLLCSVILLTEGPPLYYPVHPVLPPVYCGPSVIPSPIQHSHIRPVSPYTSPKQTSCLGLSRPRGRKQVPRASVCDTWQHAPPTCQHTTERSRCVLQMQTWC